LLGLGLLVLALFSIFAPKRPEKAAGPGGRTGRDAPVSVTTAPVRTMTVPIRLEAIGTVEASETVSVQSRAGGQLVRVYFKPGAFVTAGQRLFDIDPRPARTAAAQAESVLARSRVGVGQAQANVNGALAQVSLVEATLQRDEAQLAFAEAQEQRYRNLLARNYVTREQYGQMQTTLSAARATVQADRAALDQARSQVAAARAAVRSSQAAVAVDRAALESARLDVGFTRIDAPLSGKTGQLLVYAGNTVQPNVTALVTIARLTPIRVTFSIPEKELLSVQRAMAAQAPPVTVIIPDEQPRQEAGRLVFIDNTADATSGTVRLKAEFANEDHLLWPGRFVEVRLQLGTRANAPVIPARAVQTGQNGDFVYTVEAGHARVRPIKVERIVDGQAVIAQGLRTGEDVVLDGGPKLAPGLKVRVRR
jgi:multidrug efflux system membrane fusion protein